VVFFPGLFMCLTVVCFNIIGDEFRNNETVEK